MLFGRLRDRVSLLRALYGAGPLEMDFFAAAGERAAAVRLAECRLRLRPGKPSSESRAARDRCTRLGGLPATRLTEGPLREFQQY